MTATTAYCTSNSVFYQLQIRGAKSSLTPILRLAAVSSSSPPIISVVHADQSSKKVPVNATHNYHDPSLTIPTRFQDEILDMSVDYDRGEAWEREILAGVGLRHKSKQCVPVIQQLRPLTKRLAVPVCLLSMKDNYERVRQALYIVLPYLKFISIVRDYDCYCPTDRRTQIEILSAESCSKNRRKLPKTAKHRPMHPLSKEDFVALAANTLNKNFSRTSMNSYVDSALHCHVRLDRLDDMMIDCMIKNLSNGNGTEKTNTSKENRSMAISTSASSFVVEKPRKSLKETTTKTTTTRTTITTLTTQKTTVKHQLSTMKSVQPAKRRKTSNDNVDSTTIPNSSLTTYQRIYLKCFICGKRQHIDAQVQNSDTLHLHWLEHNDDLFLNIYDSEIDSMLTRVVEFFNFPRRHGFEGNVQTVFILNSEEVRQTRPVPLSDDNCIVID